MRQTTIKMNLISQHKKTIYRAAALTAALLLCAIVRNNVNAQASSPQIMITWSAQNYAPPTFAGKVLPTAHSPMRAAAEIIANGKLVNLRSYTIYWYLNDQFIDGGRGMSRVSFFSGDAIGPSELRVQIEDYPGGAIQKTVEVPVARPMVVIRTPFSEGLLTRTQFEAVGIPFFFNVNSIGALIFNWNVNGRVPSTLDQADRMTVKVNDDAPKGSALNVRLTVENPKESLETASRVFTLTL